MFLTKRSSPPLSLQSPQRRSDAKFCKKSAVCIPLNNRETINRDFQHFRAYYVFLLFLFQAQKIYFFRRLHRTRKAFVLIPFLYHSLTRRKCIRFILSRSLSTTTYLSININQKRKEKSYKSVTSSSAPNIVLSQSIRNTINCIKYFNFLFILALKRERRQNY
jgi:hypothetical protein